MTALVDNAKTNLESNLVDRAEIGEGRRGSRTLSRAGEGRYDRLLQFGWRLAGRFAASGDVDLFLERREANGANHNVAADNIGGRAGEAEDLRS